MSITPRTRSMVRELLDDLADEAHPAGAEASLRYRLAQVLTPYTTMQLTAADAVIAALPELRAEVCAEGGR